MKKFACAASLATACSMAWGATPNQSIVNGCLKDNSVSTSIVIEEIKSNYFTEESQYADGFDALYMFKYHHHDVGCAERKNDGALIYFERIYRLSKAIPLGDNHGVMSGDFNPSLADWSFVEGYHKKFFCVSFNFGGLGRSGDFQNIRGGYLLDVTTKDLYFVVRDIRK